MKSLGMIEVSGVTGAIDCLDIMCKSADVEFVTWERKLGGRLVTVVVQGNVSAVTAAVENNKCRYNCYWEYNPEGAIALSVKEEE